MTFSWARFGNQQLGTYRRNQLPPCMQVRQKAHCSDLLHLFAQRCVRLSNHKRSIAEAYCLLLLSNIHLAGYKFSVSLHCNTMQRVKHVQV